MPKFLQITHEPPEHGWLPLILQGVGQQVHIDASDVPNNPVQDLIAALEDAAQGREASVWWHLEPDGMFMYLRPSVGEVSLRIEHALRSDRSRGVCVFEVSGPHDQVLLPLWRFLREFQSRGYQEPHWPITDFARMDAIRQLLDPVRQAGCGAGN